MLSRFQDKEQLKAREEIYLIKTKDLKSSEFPGKKIYEGEISKLDNIKYSMVLNLNEKGFVYLAIKGKEIVLIEFNLVN